MNITKNLIDCIFFVCLGFSCIAVGIYLALKNKKRAMYGGYFSRLPVRIVVISIWI